MLKVLPPDPEIGWMDSKTVNLNFLTLGDLENEPISKTKWNVPLKENATVFPYSNMFFPQLRRVDMYLSRLSPCT